MKETGLCIDLAAEELQNDSLKKNLANEIKANKELTAEYGNLQEKYKSLTNMSLSQTDKLSKALAAKSDELNAKEKLLSEREKALHEMQQIIARQDSITKRLNSVLKKRTAWLNSDELSVESKEWQSICFNVG